MTDIKATPHIDAVKGTFSRGLRKVGRGVVTLMVIAAAVLAVQFGSTELTHRADAAPTPDAAQTLPVSASPLQLEDGYDIARSFVGQVEPQRTVALSFELSGRLSEIFADEGDYVEQGEVLARQDLSLLISERTRLMASRMAIQSQLQFADQTVERSTELTARGFASQSGLDEALSRQQELTARIAEINASLQNVEIRIEKSQIIAPFDGRISERLADGGETVAAGQHLFDLVELDQPQIRIGVPLDITDDSLFEAHIEIDGRAVPARFITIRPDIDPTTRTRTALFDIETQTPPAFGQTARLILTETVAAPGLWVPITSLQEGVRGQWTILTVEHGDQTVRAAPVEILHAEAERVYVRGAFPDGTLLINRGPQRVTVGQRVVTSASL